MTSLAISSKFRSLVREGVVCSHYFDGYLYVGAGNGIVYRTIDGKSYQEFWKTGEMVVTTISSYANALFVGTGPEGKVLMHNFSTGNRFHYLTSGDYEIASMVVVDDVLYVVTSPSGVVISFDGSRWRKEYESFYDASVAVLHDDKLYVFFKDSFSVLVKDSVWKFMEDDESPFSIAGKPKVKSTLPGLARDANYDYGVLAAASFDGKIFFSGNRKPTLYSYNDGAVTVAYQFAGDPIVSMAASATQLFVAVGDTVYYQESTTSEDTDGQ